MNKVKRYRLLCVDDDKIMLKIYQYSFGDTFDVVLAENGEEAIDLFQTNKFDAVLTDINMPGMSGYDLARLIRKINTDVVILAITAMRDLDEIHTRCAEVGLNGAFLKPIDAIKIVDCLYGTFEREEAASE